ncbi:MAG TPA: endoglucanase, partial [Polyangiaceae bacterium]
VGINNACTGGNGQWGNANAGSQYGGFLATCGNNMTCITDMCKTAFGSNSSLMAGCQWFVGWFAAANNPGIVYGEVPCPSELTSKSSLR